MRLKKARSYLRDALFGLNDADDQNLATGEWRSQARHEIEVIMREVQRLIADIRATLK